MIVGKASLVVDLGNSETRVVTLFGNTELGEPKLRLSILSNKFGELSEKDNRLLNSPDYNESNSKVFTVSRTISRNEEGLNTSTVSEEIVNSMFCSGYMCDIEKGTASIRPSASIKKYDSMISMYSMRLALLEGYKHIAEMTNSSIGELDIEWTISVLLPPSDLELGAEQLKQNILGIDEINFLIPKFRKDIKIDKVKVFPEGFCAFIGVVFENRRKIREGFMNVLNSSTLVIDIGAGTTDFCIIKDAKLVDGSRHSEEIGGNQVFQKINTELRRKFGKNFPEDSLRDSAVTGTIKVGARELDISKEIGVARKDIATRLSSTIRNYIESSDFSIYDIENILICGGGAAPCGKDMKPLGEFLKEDLKVWMSYSNFLDMPYADTVVEIDGVNYLQKEQISSRLLNIIGAGVLSEN